MRHTIDAPETEAAGSHPPLPDALLDRLLPVQRGLVLVLPLLLLAQVLEPLALILLPALLLHLLAPLLVGSLARLKLPATLLQHVLVLRQCT